MSEILIRPYEAGDEQSILEAWNSIFPAQDAVPERDLAYWQWQFVQNPLARSEIICAIADDRVVVNASHLRLILFSATMVCRPVKPTLSCGTGSPSARSPYTAPFKAVVSLGTGVLARNAFMALFSARWQATIRASSKAMSRGLRVGRA